MAKNPRYSNGNYRRKCRAWFKSMDAPCGICGGKLGPIHYDEPSDAQHPLSFVIDEIWPISKWSEGGYSSPEAVVKDRGNLQAAHYCCNSMKSNKTNFKFGVVQSPQRKIKYPKITDGEW